MPPKSPRTPERSSDQRDIRGYASPVYAHHRTGRPQPIVSLNAAATPPQRRRRIVQSDSDEEQQYTRREPVASQDHNADSAARPAQNPQISENAIDVSSGDETTQQRPAAPAGDSSDDMYIMGTVRRQQPAQRTPIPQQRSATRNTVVGEAEESCNDTDAATPDESDENAADLYRASILGVRNRTHALQQVRTHSLRTSIIHFPRYCFNSRQISSSTINCPTCQLFMRFLRHFQ